MSRRRSEYPDNLKNGARGKSGDLERKMEQIENEVRVSEICGKFLSMMSQKNDIEAFRATTSEEEYLEVKKKAEELCLAESQNPKEDPDPYGDGDQSPLKGIEREALAFRVQTEFTYEYYPMVYSDPWVNFCYWGNLDAVRACVEKDPKIIEKRVSKMRHCGLFHVIEGAVDVNEFRKRPNPRGPNIPQNHFACVKYLLWKGARTDPKDVAGGTPLHHCLNLSGTDLSYDIAKLLLEEGADPNVPNRCLGHTPLFLAMTSGQMKYVDLLLEHGADPNVNYSNKRSESIFEASKLFFPEVRSRFEMEQSKLQKEMREKAKKDGTLKTCGNCGSTENCKRCSGCFVIWYCSEICNRKNWKNHKLDCKVAQKSYKAVTLRVDESSTSMYNYKERVPVVRDPGTKLKLKRQDFIVKIHAPKYSFPYPLTIYNKEKTLMGAIDPSEPCYKEIVDIIREKGVGSHTGFFFCIASEDRKITINTKDIQPPEIW